MQLINSLVPIAHFLSPLKTSDVFRRQRKDALETNGLNQFQACHLE